MSVKFLFVIFGGIVLTLVDNARILQRVKRQSLKVRITAKDDSIVLKYLSSSPAIKLQGYILGYGGRYTKQNITLPDNGEPFEVDVEFNPRYLIAVHPVAEQSKAALKKKCKGNLNFHKPPQITIATRNPTSVFLTWTHSFEGKVYKHVGNECADERHYTVRYREKEKNNKWLYQCCPTSETMIDNLKPNTVYEFGVRVTKAKESGSWSNPTSYVTTVTSSPTSAGNDQNQKVSKKFAINFNSGNPKNARKSELPGKTNIIGIKDKKDLTASNPARNGTNWIQLLPKRPDVNTKAVLGGQSASDSAHVHPGSSSSPRPNIPSKPEHTPDQLRGKEDIKKIKNKETSNTVTKPSLKNSTTRKTKPKSAKKPLTTKESKLPSTVSPSFSSRLVPKPDPAESKLPSSVSPSFSSRLVPKPDPAEIQIPVFLTPSTPSELDTMDKQQPTEPESPPSTVLPFIKLSTTSDHTAVDMQHLPGTTSALDHVETQKFSEPEISSSSRGSFHSTFEPDAMDNEKFTEPEIRSFSISSVNTTPEPVATDMRTFTEPEVSSTTSSFPSSSNMASKLDVMDKEQFTGVFVSGEKTERVEPSSKDSFSHTTSEPDTMDNQQFTEYGAVSSISSNIITLHTTSETGAMDKQEFTEPEVQSTVNSFLTISNTIYEFDSTQREQISEYEVPFSSSSPVNTLKTSKLDAMDTKQTKEFEIPSSKSSFIFTSELNAVDNQQFTEPEVPSSTISKLFITSNPIADVDAKGQQPFTENNPSSVENSSLFDLKSVSEFEKLDQQGTTDHELPATDISYVFSSTPPSEHDSTTVKEFTDYELPVSGTPYVLSPIPINDLANIGKKEFTDHALPTPDTSDVVSPTPVSEINNIKQKDVTDHEVPTPDTGNVFSLISDSPYVFSPIIEPEPVKMGKNEVTDHEVPTSDTPNVVSLIPDNELPVTDSPYVFNPIPGSEPPKIGRNKVTAEHEVTISDTPNVFSLISEYQLPVTDTHNVFNTIPESEPANIGEKEVTDHQVPTSDTPIGFSLISDYESPVSDTLNMFRTMPESELAKIGEKEVAEHEVLISDTPNVFRIIPDHEQPITDTPNVFNTTPESEPANIGEKAVTGKELSTSDTAVMSNPTPMYDTREKKLTDHKLPTSDTSRVFIPISVSELDHTEDKEFTDHKLTNSDTSYVFNTTLISEHANIEDKEFTEHKLPTSGTPYVFIQSQESELDNTEDKDLTDDGFPTSDIPHVLSSTPVQPQLDNTGKKDVTESDPPSDSSSIITYNPMRKSDAKQEITESETQSTYGQLFSTVSGSTHENSPVFRSTPVSNIDGQGQERFRGSYVKYMTKPNMPCSITESLKHFPEENITNAKALLPPRYGPSNLTLVTVEGCPTFLIVDWEKNENDSASEYEVLSQMTGPDNKTEELITVTNQTHAAVENLKPNTSYTFLVTPTNLHGRGPSSDPLPFVTESADPSVSEYIPGKDAIWTQYSFKFDSYSECQGKRFVKRTRYRKFVGIILCNSLRYKIYLSNSLSGVFYNIGDLSGYGEDHCQFVDSFLDGRTGEHLLPEQLPIRQGFYRSVRQEPVMFGTIGGRTHINYVHWYECGIAIPGQW
ncbi:fibronectin type III domain-containing protein 1-like isoform X14 [Heterodontus francisci]|uniref:fibronectin type III domain-containing protein 1-like isoform X14 n=1 Tax=Heterodontus francisci TaxID=7792 RepID=UPI00355BED6B